MDSWIHKGNWFIKRLMTNWIFISIAKSSGLYGWQHVGISDLCATLL